MAREPGIIYIGHSRLQALFCKCAAGIGFEILFESSGLFLIAKGNSSFDSLIVLFYAIFEISS